MLCNQRTRNNEICDRSAMYDEERCYIHIRKWLKVKLNLPKCPKTSKEIFNIIENMRNTDPDYRDAYGRSIIHIGVQENNIDLIRKGISLGIYINTKTESLLTPLYFIKDNKQILLELLKAGAFIDENINLHSRTPLFNHCISPFYNKEVIRCFLEWGADSSIEDFYGLKLYNFIYDFKFANPNIWNNIECIKWRQSILSRFIKRLSNVSNIGALYDVFFSYFQLSHILCIQNV
jgi:ankyrin repeat protein